MLLKSHPSPHRMRVAQRRHRQLSGARGTLRLGAVAAHDLTHQCVRYLVVRCADAAPAERLPRWQIQRAGAVG